MTIPTALLKKNGCEHDRVNLRVHNIIMYTIYYYALSSAVDHCDDFRK